VSNRSKRARKRREPIQSAVKASSTSARRWWWIGGAVLVVLLIAVILWFTVGPGRPEGEQERNATMPANPIDRNNMYSAPPAMQIDTGKTYVATLSTAKGDIVVQLDAGAAPQTVNNFAFLAREGFYDGLTFHRVEPGFVIQGGDPLGSGTGGSGYTVPAEIGLPHVEGAIAMARRADEVNPARASSGSQFYITLAPTPFLDGGYTVFGQVIEGMEVVKSIAVGDMIEEIAIAEE
jgi:peptidyl-prolyl cis-trans isomerase B (cyclophilin B)